MKHNNSVSIIEDLLTKLVEMLDKSPEICDTDVRENLYDVFFRYFINNTDNKIDKNMIKNIKYGLFDDEEEDKLGDIIVDSLENLNQFAHDNNLSPVERYNLLYQNIEVAKATLMTFLGYNNFLS